LRLSGYSRSDVDPMSSQRTSRLQHDHICIINTKEPYFHWEFAMHGRITRITRYKVAKLGPYHANYAVQNSTPSYETLYRRTTSRLQEDHICIINTKEPCFHQESAMYGRIARITWYKVAKLWPYYANYVVQNSTPSYETLYRRTTSRLQKDHICIINTKQPYFHWELAMYGRITRYTWYKVAKLGPIYANYVVQNSISSYETLYMWTTSRLQEDHISIINTKKPCFHWEFATHGRITRITWYKVAILWPNYVNYVVQNSISSYETLYKRTTYVL
jgi:hypothetical protein